MAFTNQDITAAYNQRGNASEAEFASWANSQGVSNDQLLSARSELIGSTSAPAPAPSPAPAPAPAPSFGRFTDDQYGSFRDWSSGKSLAEITAKAGEIGATADEIGYSFGQFGGNGQQVTSLTGYGSGISGFRPDGSFDYQTGYINGDLANGTNARDWTYDSTKGWVKAVKKPAKKPLMMEMPTTGINLSQVQGTTPWDVAQNQTVANQISQIISADSPLMQQARMRAMQSANASGLLNSTMAASAGESALYDAAMPIAQQDASTYASAAQFNADASNTFSRDNNAFVRDAFMADFNLKANEWAKQQDQQRTYDAMDYESKLTLERDAIQNGYQSARDAIQNGYAIDADNRKFEWQSGENVLDRAADADKLTWQSGENVLDRANAITRASMSAPAPDTSLQRTAMTIAADKEMAALNRKNAAQETLTNARAQFNKDVLTININDLSTERADNAYADLATNYNAIVDNVATNYGLDSADSWKVEVPVAAPAVAAAPVAPAGTDGG